MWPPYFIIALTTITAALKPTSLFRQQHLIYSSTFTITKILVPVHQNKYHNSEISDVPTIFFTITDQKLHGGSCVYVLKDYATYEVLEGGRDSTADYSNDRTIYIGAKDGIYKYDKEVIAAKKLGPFRDNIIQIQKANATDILYILTSDYKMYKIEKNGTIKTKITSVTCAREFVLDVSNNIYYVDCKNKQLHIIKFEGKYYDTLAHTSEVFQSLMLIRPAFIMENSVPFLGNGRLHVLYSNGTVKQKEFFTLETPSAISVDTALYVVLASKGKIYEYNVMDDLLKSMFSEQMQSQSNVTRLIMSVIDGARDGLFGIYKTWY